MQTYNGFKNMMYSLFDEMDMVQREAVILRAVIASLLKNGVVIDVTNEQYTEAFSTVVDVKMDEKGIKITLSDNQQMELFTESKAEISE